MNGPFGQEKACAIAKELGSNEFGESSWWLHWLHHGFVYKQTNGGTKSVDEAGFFIQLQASFLRDGHAPTDIYNTNDLNFFLN